MANKISIFLFTLFLYSCAVTNTVLYDYDLEANFDSYSTYVLCSDDFMIAHDNHPKIDNEQVRALIGDAIAVAMEQRGHKTNVFEPQLQAGFRIAITQETAKFNNCEHSSELDYWESCDIHKETYNQETLVAYVAEFKTNKVIWQASIPCALNKSQKQLPEYINSLVAQLFETYPRQ